MANFQLKRQADGSYKLSCRYDIGGATIYQAMFRDIPREQIKSTAADLASRVQTVRGTAGSARGGAG
jgi:hypothetical protein